MADRSSGDVRRRRVDCWDVKGKADGVQWFKRFGKAGLAQTWKGRVEQDFTRGLVIELTEVYSRQHPEWDPKTKASGARSFNRARRLLLAPGTEPTEDDLAAVDDLLKHASFLPAHLEKRITARQQTG